MFEFCASEKNGSKKEINQDEHKENWVRTTKEKTIPFQVYRLRKSILIVTYQYSTIGGIDHTRRNEAQLARVYNCSRLNAPGLSLGQAKVVAHCRFVRAQGTNLSVHTSDPHASIPFPAQQGVQHKFVSTFHVDHYKGPQPQEMLTTPLVSS